MIWWDNTIKGRISLQRRIAQKEHYNERSDLNLKVYYIDRWSDRLYQALIQGYLNIWQTHNEVLRGKHKEETVEQTIKNSANVLKNCITMAHPT